MTACACGFEAADLTDLTDHLEEVYDRPDSRDASGVEHAEVEHPGAPHSCLCGHESPDATALNRHLLAAFAPADHIGNDGHKHGPLQTA